MSKVTDNRERIVRGVIHMILENDYIAEIADERWDHSDAEVGDLFTVGRIQQAIMIASSGLWTRERTYEVEHGRLIGAVHTNLKEYTFLNDHLHEHAKEVSGAQNLDEAINSPLYLQAYEQERCLICSMVIVRLSSDYIGYIH